MKKMERWQKLVIGFIVAYLSIVTAVVCFFQYCLPNQAP